MPERVKLGVKLNLFKCSFTIKTLAFSCTGCFACASACPIGAISPVQNSEGFYEIEIDETKCTGCNLCKTVCPQINKPNLSHLNNECYAIKADDKIRKQSSSGGLFTILSEYFINRGGISLVLHLMMILNRYLTLLLMILRIYLN